MQASSIQQLEQNLLFEAGVRGEERRGVLGLEDETKQNIQQSTDNDDNEEEEDEDGDDEHAVGVVDENNDDDKDENQGQG